MRLRTFLSGIRNILNEIRLVSDKRFEEEQQTEPFAPIFDFTDEMARIKMGIKTTTCEARDYPDLRRQLEQASRDIVDNNR